MCRASLGGATGPVVGLDHEGERLFLESFGSAAPGGDRLEAEATFSFPAFTEVLVATLAAALASGGAVDFDAPISARLPELSPGLGSATLRQLLGQRAGLDHAPVPDTADWEEVLDRLDDRALMTVPGVVFSRSRYSHPLTVRVLERATGVRFEEAAGRALLDPLEMEATSFGSRGPGEARDGLPVTRTTTPDTLRFWAAWLDGRIDGVGGGAVPAGDAPERPSDPVTGARLFEGGVWHVLSRLERWPRETVVLVLSRVAPALGLGDEIYAPLRLDGGGRPARVPSRCREPAVADVRVDDFGPRVPAGDRPGRYRNGDFTSMDLPDGPAVGFPSRLFDDEAGRRYVVVGDRTYLHEDDRPYR